MLSTLFLAATLAQVGSGGGMFPSSADTGMGSMGSTPMGGVIPATDPARDRGPVSSGTTGTAGTSASSGGLSSPTQSGSSGAGSTGAGTEAGSETSGRVSGGGTGTTGDSSTNGGTNSARPLR
jgi:hypothetical protein